MLETPEEVARLQSLLDRSAASAGPHLRSMFGDEHRMTASELIDALPGLVEVHLAVVTGDGAPLVAPVDAILCKGELWIGLPGASVRSRLLRRDPRVSLSYTAGDTALIVHGTFEEVAAADATAYAALARRLYIEQYGDWFAEVLDRKQQTPNDDLTGRITPRVLFAKH